MSKSFEIVSVNRSVAKGTVKEPVTEAWIDATGVVGDAHAGPGLRQVSLLSVEAINRFARKLGREFRPGDFGENITTRGLELREVAMLDRFGFGEVELEVTQLGKKCHGDGCAIYREVGKCVMPAEGVFARVVNGGPVRPGDRGQFVPRPLRLRVVTLSDRAAQGVYADRSGPRIRELLEAHFAGKRWHTQIESALLPDDAALLRAELLTARGAGVDVVFTTGGTGVGLRDITPEVVTEVCDKLLPGIMENIRLKFGAQKPNALLSRSVAGVAGQTQIYALPGSVRAVEEYMGEILKTLEHALGMIHGLDLH
jgi:molybdenum cofactor synthesis domain-containing protein